MDEEVPLYKPQNVIGEEVLSGITEVLASGWLTLGPKTRAFEEQFSRAHGCEHGVAVNSCTSALYTVLSALDIEEGDKVVVPAMTFSATANVVELLGGEVVLCDVKQNGNLDVKSLESILNRYDISAVIVVHLYGLPADMMKIGELCKREGVDVVEDCAHAPGATLNGKPVGSFGTAGCFSFYATKNMTTGEGGMVVTNDAQIAESVKKLRNHHQTKSPSEKKQNWGYDIDGLGFNFRMSDFQAAIGLNQIERLPELNKSRQEVATQYKKEISQIDGLEWYGSDQNKEHVFHLFVTQVRDEYPMTRDELYEHLSEQGIITGVHYPPISELSYYENVKGEDKNAKDLFGRILSIPMYPGMKREDQSKVIDALKVS